MSNHGGRPFRPLADILLLLLLLLLLCGRSMSCPSVFPSVWQRLSRMGPQLENKNAEKSKLVLHVPLGTNKRSADFHMKRSKVKVNGRQKLPQSGGMLTYGRPIKRRRVRRRLQSRPTPLLGLIYCPHIRRSAAERTVAYHVGTRRRHDFLLLSLLSISINGVKT